MVSVFYTIFRFSIFLIIVVLIDFYVFYGIKTAIGKKNDRLQKVFKYIYWIINIGFLLAVALVLLNVSHIKSPPRIIYPLLAILVLMLVPKLVFSIVLLMEDLIRLFKQFYKLYIKYISKKSVEGISNGRRKFLSRAGMIVAGIPFVSIVYGLWKGKYDFRIHEVELFFEDLPSAFNGFTITQLSDIHSGSFDSPEDVKRGVDMANDLKSDLILFTGDLVNSKTDEIYPWMDVFSTLKAPYGVYSIFGNHDYGDYYKWDSEEDKRLDHEELKKVHAKLNFKLMLNESTLIEKDGEKIALIGLENWGLPPFPQYGNLKKAMQGVEEEAFKILMSHDPSHWDAEVSKNKTNINLTLAGHTHGMQFGVEIPGFKWSPVQYKYPKWAGLYKENQQYLYVNRGFGFIGFPGRVGIWPEITKITLKKALT